MTFAAAAMRSRLYWTDQIYYHSTAVSLTLELRFPVGRILGTRRPEYSLTRLKRLNADEANYKWMLIDIFQIITKIVENRGCHLPVSLVYLVDIAFENCSFICNGVHHCSLTVKPIS